ncbi:MAG TPA: hypothetical protein VFB09_06230 [Actinomycetota bacterium]|nr:hypothetical protein [Actinomycetota bacterium]
MDGGVSGRLDLERSERRRGAVHQAIIHWHVFTRNVGDPVKVEYDGVLAVRFASDGRCSEHREWYFRRELPG